jgi:hypothetical protein
MCPLPLKEQRPIVMNIMISLAFGQIENLHVVMELNEKFKYIISVCYYYC